MEKKLAAAVRKVAGRDKVTALGERDLVRALAGSGYSMTSGEGSDPVPGDTSPIGVICPACPHVEYPASA
ncbi:MAG TPA: hypothetical protein VGE98_17010 [Thermoanaerobaculia bacterium]